METELWRSGLLDHGKWPDNPVKVSSRESESKAKLLKTVLCAAQTEQSETDSFDRLIDRNRLRTAFRVTALVIRFTRNCRIEQKSSGVLGTLEVEEARDWWIKRVQYRGRTEPQYAKTKESLNLQVNQKGLLECRGRIEGKFPIYLPPNAPFTRKRVEKVHAETLHGGVG